MVTIPLRRGSKDAFRRTWVPVSQEFLSACCEWHCGGCPVRRRSPPSSCINTRLLAMPYRKDIDAVRAVAVLAVFFIARDDPGISGRTVGADVIFVISGFDHGLDCYWSATSLTHSDERSHSVPSRCCDIALSKPSTSSNSGIHVLRRALFRRSCQVHGRGPQRGTEFAKLPASAPGSSSAHRQPSSWRATWE